MYKQPVLSKEKENNAKQGKTCLLLYSGGVDTSVSVYLLKHYYGYTVYTFSVDICQDAIWAHNMAKKALTIGASKAYVYDGKKEFADTYLSQVIKSNGYYDDYYPIGTSIARPWQAKLGIDIAKKLHVDAIAHGNKGRGAGAFQFNMVLNFFAPKNLKLEAPITDWWPTRRDEYRFRWMRITRLVMTTTSCPTPLTMVILMTSVNLFRKKPIHGLSQLNTRLMRRTTQN